MAPVLPPELPEIPGYQHLRLVQSQEGAAHLYRGMRLDTGQEVLINLWPAPNDAQDALIFQQRFDQERRIARLPPNTHLLVAIDHGAVVLPGSEVPRLYLVYPPIEYSSFAELLTREKPWATWELPHIADVIAQAADGLFHLHTHGFVYQYLRPSSFVWMPADSLRNPLRRIHIWLTDFATAEPVGSGQTEGVTQAADQYALALVARLLLTGHEPASRPSTPPTQLNPQRLFEPEVDAALFKALATQPEARFSSVIDFAQALQRAILKQIQSAATAREGTPLLSPPVARPKKTIVLPPLIPPKPYEPPRPRNSAPPRLAGRAGAAGPMLPPVPAQQWLTVTLPGALRMLAWSPSGTELACTFYHDQPQIISVKHSVETLAGFAAAHSACWSPDGRFLALSMDDANKPQAEIRFYDRTASKERSRALSFDQPEPIRGMDWSRRGLFAIWLHHKILVYDLSNLATQKRFPEPIYTAPLGDEMSCDQLTTLRWSPRGDWLAAGSNNGAIVCWQPYTDQYVEEHPLTKNIRSIGWSPNGKTLVVAFANKQVLFWNMQNGEITQAELPAHPRMVSTSPQTEHIAIATEKTLFFFENAGTSAPTARHPGQLFAAFSSDNKLATLDEHESNTLIIWQI